MRNRMGVTYGAPTPTPAPRRDQSMWEFMFGPTLEEPEGRKAEQAPARPTTDPNVHFDVEAMWKYILESRQNPQFKVGGMTMVPLSQISKPTNDVKLAVAEIVAFFGLPVGAFQGMDPHIAWNQQVAPFIKLIETNLNATKPWGLRGEMKFEIAKDGSFNLSYLER